MRSPLPVRRGLDIVAPLTLYRAIGRRPSEVYVDSDRRVTGSAGGQRLWDLVYEEHVAQPGCQLQERQGGIMLLTATGDTYPVQLSPPQARTAEDAFTHAGHALTADWAMIERLIAEGSLVVATIRRSKVAPFNPAQVKFDEHQPLVTSAGISSAP